MVMHVTFILGKKGKFEIRVQPLFHLGVVEVVNKSDHDIYDATFY